MYETTAAVLVAAYLTVAVWAVRVAVHNRRRCRADWPLTLLIAAVSAVWAAWYLYLLLCHPPAGGAAQLVNRTLHAPTIALFAVACAWRGR